MAESEGISVEQFGTLAERAGLTMKTEELTALKPMFDYYAKQIKLLFEIELEAEDMAVMYSPNWDPQG
jgi:single-stranded DNA-specific DHH superfamily exonuclease